MKKLFEKKDWKDLTLKEKITRLSFLFVCIFIISLAFVSGSEDETVSEQTFNKMSEEEKINFLVEDAVGKKSNRENYPDRITSIVITGNEKRTIKIGLIGNSNLSTNMTKFGMFADTQRIMESLTKQFDNLYTVQTTFEIPLVDTYGNVELTRVMYFDFIEETIYKTQWDNILTDNIPKIADFKYIHPIYN